MTAKPKREFKEASRRVAKKAKSVDCLLKVGSLDCSACGHVLFEVSGRSVYDATGWSANYVQYLADEAKWPKPSAYHEKWAIESARAFIETCAKLKRSIHFSW